MRKMLLYAAILIPGFAFSQVGLKAGINFANVSTAASINNSNKSGFHIGAMLASPSKKILSSRTELIFSRQGYDYKTSNNTGDVNLDYIQFGQLMSINITKYFSLLLGAQTAYLISAKVDSANGNGNEPGSQFMDLYNRFDYGYAAGVEVHPFMGLLIGARYNVSLNKIYQSTMTGQMPSFSSEDAKNNVVQIYLGWRLGKTEKKNQ